MLYGAKLYDIGFKRGEAHSELKSTICISFVDFDLFEGETEFHTCLVPTDIHRKHVMLMNGVRLHFIEMEKAKNREGTLAELVRLLQEIKPQLEENMSELLQKNPVYEEIYGDYLHCIEDEQARHDAISREKWLFDYHHGMKYNYNKGVHEKAIEVAKTALEEGLSVPMIAKLSGLSEEEISSINNCIINN